MPNSAGSAYLELENPPETARSVNAISSSLKLSCAVHGPKPLPRNANFSPNLQLSVTVKFAPFAARNRRGYIRDAIEKDIGTHLETALYGVIIPDRWPKSAIEVVITIFEAEDDMEQGVPKLQSGVVEGLGIMNVISGCITVASAALLDARIDCLDLVAGGVAATATNEDEKTIRILDPSPSEGPLPRSACVVGYMPTRDEVTLTWAKGNIPTNNSGDLASFDMMLDGAISAAKGAHFVLRQVATELSNTRALQYQNNDPKG